MVNLTFELLSQTVLPPTCIVCGDDVRLKGARAIDLCAACNGDLAPNSHACAVCAEPLPPSVPDNSICGVCLQKRPRYHASLCAFRYTYPIDHLVRAFKFHGRLAYGRVLGELLSVALSNAHRDAWPALLIPVPLADARFRERGFNQAIELGRIVAARLRIPLRPDLVLRTRMTREQTGLDSKARRKNLRGAFAVGSPLPAKHVAIIDDVVTTGSTANELARVLRRAGAKRIEVWAVARTPR